MGFIDAEQFATAIAKHGKSDYAAYLRAVADEAV